MTTMNETYRPDLKSLGIAKPLCIAVGTFVTFVGALAAWSALAPLESAALAPGVVVVDTNRKAVQHLEGGVVGRLMVHEGDEVKEGQLLVQLDQTQVRSAVERLRAQLIASQALQARLKAERDEVDAIAFPAEFVANIDDPAVAEVVQGELRIFEARREQLASQERILKQRTAQVTEEGRGINEEIRAQDKQLRLIREEAAGIEALVDKGLERKPRLLGLQRQSADIEGQRAQNVARIARGQQLIGENELRAVDLRAQMLSETVQKLREEEAKILDTREKIRAAEDVLQRTDIRAPVAGRVQGLKVFTVGGVVPPRETIMEIVPADEKLVVEAQMGPSDIDNVRPGLPVQLRFTAFNQRSSYAVDGRVTTVSADRLTDQRTGTPYYLLRIAIEGTMLLPAGQGLYPGMPVEAMVRTGSQTLMAYLTKPITDSMARAFRED